MSTAETLRESPPLQTLTNLPNLPVLPPGLEATSSSALVSVPGDFAVGDTSIKVFRRHLAYVKVGENLIIDASKINDEECFKEWAATRHGVLDLEKTFQRCLTAHVTGSDGRRPFEAEEEQAILQVVRLKRQWPAFKGTDLTIGLKGFRGVGYHEKQSITNSRSLVGHHHQQPISRGVTSSSSSVRPDAAAAATTTTIPVQRKSISNLRSSTSPTGSRHKRSKHLPSQNLKSTSSAVRKNSKTSNKNGDTSTTLNSIWDTDFPPSQLNTSAFQFPMFPLVYNHLRYPLQSGVGSLSPPPPMSYMMPNDGNQPSFFQLPRFDFGPRFVPPIPLPTAMNNNNIHEQQQQQAILVMANLQQQQQQHQSMVQFITTASQQQQQL